MLSARGFDFALDWSRGSIDCCRPLQQRSVARMANLVISKPGPTVAGKVEK